MLTNVKVVIGANFGDEGKGMMTDFFANKYKDTNCVVVLHNGGAQRGHTVVTPEGYRHVFHHFGSGTFAGAATYIAKPFIVNPILFKKEWMELEALGETPRVYINPNCCMTTLYDMLVNQVIEADRGTGKHGSCGVGIYETLYRNQVGLKFVNEITIKPMELTVRDFHNMTIMDKFNFLDTVRKYYTAKRLDELHIKKDNPLIQSVMSSHDAFINYVNDFNFMIEHCIIEDDAALDRFETAIFENGQGLLLDCDNMEYFPHLTPSHTGMYNPRQILNDIGYTGRVEACYVTRSYITRHGKGRLDNERSKREVGHNIVDMTNVPNPFQDELRYAPLDADTLIQRINADAQPQKYENIHPTIAITHTNENHSYFVAADYHSGGMTRDSITDWTHYFK